jgi:hypothetical protein
MTHVILLPIVSGRADDIMATLAQRWRSEGHAKGVRATLRMLLTEKFGELDPKHEARIEQAGSKELETFVKRVVKVDTIDAVLEPLARAGQPDGIDWDRVDEAALAILCLTLHDGRAWKSIDWDIMNRLYERGWILDPRSNAKSVVVTEEGEEWAAEFLRKQFGRQPPGSAR